MIKGGYLLVTPAKNEEKFLPRVIDAVVNQTIIPNLWVIVDDGSTDETPQIIKEAQMKYEWIKSIRLPEHPRDITFHYSYVCREGFKYVLNYAKVHHIPFEFVALLDADTVPEKRYFEKIIGEFEKDHRLGIASGSIYVKKRGKWRREINLTTYPRGTGRVWRKKCFFDTGGYRLVPSPDSVSNSIALNKRWRIKEFKHVKAFQLRETSSAEGIVRGYIKNGEMAWCLRKPLWKIIANTIWYSTAVHPLSGISYLYGFIQSIQNTMRCNKTLKPYQSHLRGE